MLYEDEKLDEEMDKIIQKDKIAPRKMRHGSFAISLNAFVLIYHLFQQFIFPLSITLLTRDKKFLKFEWMWVYHAGLIFLIRYGLRKRMLTHAIALLGFVLSLYRLYETAWAKNWHTFSVGLTAFSTISVLAVIYAQGQSSHREYEE